MDIADLETTMDSGRSDLNVSVRRDVWPKEKWLFQYVTIYEKYEFK